MAKSDRKPDTADSKKPAAGAADLNTAVAPLRLEQPTLSSGELGTLQEILFGKQMAAHGNQISSLHSHVEDQLANLQKNCEQQFAELHRKLDESLSGVNSQLEQNDKKQTSGLAETNNKLGVAESNLMSQLSQANDSNGKVQGELEAQLNKACEHLTNSVQSSRDEIMQRLETAVADLKAQKLDKGALSSLLGDVATQLTGQPKT
ncbi:MAG: hypothetical protein V3U65_11775 [Granulosicoccaceae bacterium]